MVELKLGERDFCLATNLRVAYNVQGQHNHKSYMEIFKGVDSMTLEDQIGILYEAAKVGTPDFNLKRNEFFELYLDNADSNVTNLMRILKQIFEGVLGKKIEEPQEEASGE